MATIKEITAQLELVHSLSDPLWDILAEDQRSGVIKAIKKRQAFLQALEVEKERLYQMSAYERQLYGEGVKLIAGIDEVGRGPLAGPVVAAAVILPKNCQIMGLNDSKKIPKSKHASIYQKVIEEAIAVGIGIVDEKTIDDINIYEATKLAMLEALGKLEPVPNHILIDAMRLDIPLPQISIIKGDANSISIAAASIVAKVTRDRLMETYDQLYPDYHFAQNVGYGTKAHLLAIDEKGICPIHRRSFEPIKSLLARQNND